VHRFGIDTLMLLLALGAMQAPVHAQDAFLRCAGIEDANARLACFDAASGRPERAAKGEVAVQTAGSLAPVAAQAALPTQSAPAVPTAAQARPNLTPEQAVADFGLSAQMLQKAAGTDQISAVVKSVGDQAYIGRWVVTLDNGQVWEQRETTAATKRPRPGDEVTIKEASLGSYLMITAGRGSSRVKRVR
jgi:hypothetical protein